VEGQRLGWKEVACGMKGITENEFQQQVIDLCHLLGWRVAHFRGVRIQRKDGSVYYQTPVQADGKGFVDLVLVNKEKKRVIFSELKTDKGRLSPEQKEWIEDLREAGQEVYIWRPKDWEEIMETLE